MTEEEFAENIKRDFDNQYHSNIKKEALDKAENDEEYWIKFKQHLYDLSVEMYDPNYEGLFVKLMFRDYLYINYPFDKKDFKWLIYGLLYLKDIMNLVKKL